MSPILVALSKLVEEVGPVAVNWIEGLVAGSVDELPPEHRERARAIIEPALRRGLTVEAAIDDDIAATKARIEAHAVEVGDDDDGDEA